MDKDTLDALKYTAWVLVGALSYFLKDAHTSIKKNIDKKADQATIEKALQQHKDDMVAMEERHREETNRIERQYAAKISDVVTQFSERINTLESNLLGRMDLLLQIMDRKSKS